MTALLAALALSTASLAAEPAPAAAVKHKRPALAAGLNFFLPGSGYLYNGEKPLYVSVPMMAGAAGLTYVEQIHQFDNGTLREQDPTAFAVTFGAVFVLNTGAAIDAWREAKAINLRAAEGAAAAGPDVRLSPSTFAGEQGPRYGLTLDIRY